MAERGDIYLLDPQTGMLTAQRSGIQISLGKFHSALPVITLDPGHGVNYAGAPDHGTTRHKVTESSLTAKLSLLTAQSLVGRGFDVIVTRTGDQYPRLQDGFEFRRAAAQAATAAFISLHINSEPTGLARGGEIYIDERSASSAGPRLLRSILREAGLVHDRRAERSEGYKVLDPFAIGINRPAALVEAGFLTNRHDFANLTNPTWQQSFATELADKLERFSKLHPLTPRMPFGPYRLASEPVTIAHEELGMLPFSSFPPHLMPPTLTRFKGSALGGAFK